MLARINPLLAAIGGVLALAAAVMVAGPAAAGGCGCTTPPSCCAPPTPPTPPSHPCCQPPSINVNIPGVNVNVGASVIVNANVQAQANVSGSAGGTVYFGGNGGAGGYLMPGTPGVISGLNVEGGMRRTAYEESRAKLIKVVIEAVCLDDKDVPHPASQVSPDRDIEDAYDGELYRCIAGTRMQYTWAEFNGHVAFDHGVTVTCQKGEALYHFPAGAAGPGPAAGGPGPEGQVGAKLECRPQRPARDCNERSLLRRFGAGVKVLTLLTVEKYTAYREETIGATTTTALTLDGGVGGVMY
jgi:hypothetical protein